MAGMILLAAMPALQAEPEIVPGSTESSPSRSQYFSWINNRNEGATESQTLQTAATVASRRAYFLVGSAKED